MAILIGIAGYVSLRMSRDALQDSIGDNAVRLAQHTMAEIDETIYNRAEEMQVFAQAALLADDAIDSNLAFTRIPDLEGYIGAIDSDWKAGEETPVIGTILNNGISRKLRRFIQFFENEYGYRVLAEAYVTNAHGVVIGSTGRTSDYLQADEEWYQQAVIEEEFWVGDLEYDESSGSFAIDLVVNLYDGDGEFAGILKGVLNIEDVRNTIIQVQSQSQFDSMVPYLIDRNGLVVFSGLDPSFKREGMDVKLKEFGVDASSYPAVSKATQVNEGFLVHEGTRDDLQTKLLTAFSKSKGYREFNGLGWSLFVEYETSDILSPISRVRTLLLSTLIGTVAIAILFSFYTSQSITRRINLLVAKVQTISLGDWTTVAELPRSKVEHGKDEIGQLSSSFEQMAIRLKAAHGGLEKRTEELEETQKGLEKEIFERKQASEELQRTLSRLYRSNKDLEEFAHIASHDLQEPLRMVSSYTQLLERRYKDQLDSDANDFIGYAADGARRMQTLINDLLAYSRITMQGNEFELTNCSDVLDQAASNLTAAIEESGVVLTRDPLPTLAVDASQLLSVFQNLISNAIKFRCDEAPSISVSAVESEDEWVFAVKDNGIGIEAEYAERIFIIFQRLHGKTEYAGTGIGLAICKKIIERHGGRIWMESEPGTGSSFYFTFPIRRDEESNHVRETNSYFAGGRQSR